MKFGLKIKKKLPYRYFFTLKNYVENFLSEGKKTFEKFFPLNVSNENFFCYRTIISFLLRRGGG